MAQNRFVLYVLGFIFTLHVVLPVYINSSFLKHITSETFVGVLFMMASLFTVLTLCYIPHVLERFGNYKVILTFFILEFLAMMCMAFVPNHITIILAFLISFVATALINFHMDIFIENMVKAEHMGKIRGIFLTSQNLAWVAGALLQSFILVDEHYWKIYLTSAVLVFPIIGILTKNFSKFKDRTYKDMPVVKTVSKVARDKNTHSSFMVSFLLQLFYAWMVIYLPIYLHDHVGFDWQEISLMFAIILLPFVITEIPLGKLADSKLGEKELMTIGFIIMAMSTFLISFIEGSSFLIWTSVLFTTRIGASIVEIMSETYFFKKIDGRDVNVMSLYRTMRPSAYVIGTILSTGILALGMDIKYMFLILAFMMFYGLRHSLAIEDTR